MGRLFWKFFLAFFIAQLTAIAGVGLTLWLRGPESRFPSVEEEAELLRLATYWMRVAGIDGLSLHRRSFGPHWPAVWLIGIDLDADGFTATASSSVHRPLPPQTPLALVAAFGRWYLVGLEHSHAGFGPPGAPPRPPPGPMVPLPPIVAGLIASLLFGALLARHFSSPIRRLRIAVNAAARGDLTVHPGHEMGNRADDLADLARDFDRMVVRLNDLVESQKRLLHDVSHEMRSPLARQQMALDIARQQPSKLSACMNRIEHELNRMDMLVGEVLDLARLESRHDEQPMHPVDIQPLLKNIVEDACFEGNTQHRRVTLEMSHSVQIPGNAELLYRAFENVVRNALTHTPDGTTVAVQVTSGNAQDLRVTICDRGPGVADEELEHIFLPFRRGVGSEVAGHYGLGLAIARRIVESHGGEISAANCVDGGLCVVISLPTYS